GSYTGYGKRQPSEKAPVLTPRELAVLASGGPDAGHGTNGSPSNGNSGGVTHTDEDAASHADSAGSNGSAGHVDASGFAGPADPSGFAGPTPQTD
ncbi:MAG TPA: hypothetical protein VK662_10995, partial [Acidothermaceae bacterium]|nr:hypothetical protein [Acidothermaceae bacterium]